MKRLTIQNLLFIVCALSAAAARAQNDEPAAVPAPALQSSPDEVAKPKPGGQPLNFVTGKAWAAARWYVVGKWVHGDGIKWLGSEGGTRTRLPAECIAKQAPFAATLERSGRRDESLKDSEILAYGDWIAVEVSPTVREEEFLVKGRTFKSDPSCQAKVSLSYLWAKESGKIKPLLFLTSTGSRFYGHQINFDSPSPADTDVADISLELLLGAWPGKVPNAGTGAKPSVMFAPVATARGEWLPLQEYWGLTLSLEQTVASFGGAYGQKALFSDWQAGTFFEYYFAVADGLQFRVGGKYHQHLADDSSLVPSFLPANKDAKYLVASTTLNFYFAKSLLLGVDFDYGMPGRLAGRGVTQSYMNSLARFGYRTNSFMYIILEGGMRRYQIQGAATESAFLGQAGIRLDL